MSLGLLLGLVGVAFAGVCHRVDSKDTGISSSKGFNLVIDLADPSKDFDPPVQNTYVTSIHTGAGLALVGNTDDKSTGRVFYQNGTEAEYKDKQSTVITDGGTPPFPSGFTINSEDGDDGITDGHLDAGPGTPGVALADEDGESYLLPNYYLACYEPLEYYQGQKFIVIRHSDNEDDVPEQCRSVRLVPQCAKLNNLPKDALSSHEYALDSPCYKDVASAKLDG
jgi:hypothetical protein